MGDIAAFYKKAELLNKPQNQQDSFVELQRPLGTICSASSLLPDLYKYYTRYFLNHQSK